MEMNGQNGNLKTTSFLKKIKSKKILTDGEAIVIVTVIYVLSIIDWDWS